MSRVVVFAVLLTLALPAQAHDAQQLDDWVEEWVEQADIALSPELLLAHQDMVERHPHYFNPQPQRVDWAGTVEEWRPLVAGHFGEKVETAMCLIYYESKGDPNAISPHQRLRTDANPYPTLVGALWGDTGGSSNT